MGMFDATSTGRQRRTTIYGDVDVYVDGTDWNGRKSNRRTRRAEAKPHHRPRKTAVIVVPVHVHVPRKRPRTRLLINFEGKIAETARTTAATVPHQLRGQKRRTTQAAAATLPHQSPGQDRLPHRPSYASKTRLPEYAPIRPRASDQAEAVTRRTCGSPNPGGRTPVRRRAGTAGGPASRGRGPSFGRGR